MLDDSKTSSEDTEDIQEEIPTDSTAGSTLMRSGRERHSPDHYGVEANTVDTRAVPIYRYISYRWLIKQF